MQDKVPLPYEERKENCKRLVLIIDDQPEYAKLFELLSDRLGVTVHIVNTCAEGLRALDKYSFEVVLMDWLMPEVDGPQCACLIRNKEKGKNRRIPIIGVSGYVGASREECIKAGMDDYIPIPFSLSELQEVLCKWMPEQCD